MDKHYVIYQITNKINKKIYIGAHCTKNIDDNYMGSGRYIKAAIKHFGLEYFEKIILFKFDTKEEMLAKERELVNENFILDNQTYNVIVGGKFHTGDFVTVKNNEGETCMIHKNDSRYLTTHFPVWLGRKHSDKTKKKMSKKAKLRSCNTKGTVWINNMIESKMIDKSELSTYLKKGWFKGSLHISKQNKEKRWINKNGINKYVFYLEVEEYLSDGWIKGRAFRRRKRSD